MFTIYLHLPFQIERNENSPLHGGWIITLLSGKGMMVTPFHFEGEGGHPMYFEVYIFCILYTFGIHVIYIYTRFEACGTRVSRTL